MRTAQHRTYVEFLDFFHQWKRILGPVDVEGQFGRLAEQIASMHPEIGALADPGWARIVKYSIGRMVQPAACP